MGTGNALRATETFTLIQLEEERQKLKKKELLKSMLTDSEFSIKGQCAINLMMTKLDIINTFLLMKYKRNFIQMKTWRLKRPDRKTTGYPYPENQRLCTAAKEIRLSKPSSDSGNCNSIPERKPVDQTGIAASNCCHGLLGQPRPSIALQTRTKAGSSDQ